MDFCVECGSQETELYSHLCFDCFLSKDIIVPPDYLTIDMCQSCGRVLAGSVWDFAPLEAHAIDLLTAQTRVHPDVKIRHWELDGLAPDKGEHETGCRVTASAGSREFAREFTVTVRVRYHVCPTCSRRRGNYYEAVLQLRCRGAEARNADSDLARVHERILDMVDASAATGGDNAFLTRYERVRGGIDYYLGSLALARTVAAALKGSEGAAVKESSSLVGMRDGSDLYRWTILVRLPDMARGDVVALDGALYLVESPAGRNLTLRGLDSGLVRRVRANMPGLKPVARHEDLPECVVVSHDVDTVQVLEPDTMKTLTLALPKGMGLPGETVRLVYYREEYRIVP